MWSILTLLFETSNDDVLPGTIVAVNNSTIQWPKVDNKCLSYTNTNDEYHQK